MNKNMTSAVKYMYCVHVDMRKLYVNSRDNHLLPVDFACM